MKKFLTISELQVDDMVVPCSTDSKEKGMTFMVTDLHPTVFSNGEFKNVAVTLWQVSKNHWGPGHHQYGHEFVSRTSLYELIERRWNN